ncbi:heparinase II/III domain-containing protein [Cellulomonas biazotea]|uniref:Heparinase II/III-like C-terminal domain-containing protein n=1 Tax=Cellulomonas biazotea TaxID=1709 RepID=A0A402DTW4_9CELL|nr:heparinase II/III family protein [Cellulomonas biazotea]GCE77542.1 hypothetical protein CBZ_25980 [Cellulomonas biazotea]
MTSLHDLWAGATTPDVVAPLLTAGTTLPIPPATDRPRWTVIADRLPADLRATADAERGTPWPQPLASGYARVWRDGDRAAHEAVVFARQRRLARAVLLAAATTDDPWLDEVVDGVTLLCEQSSWCWPAHDDVHRRTGDVVPDVDDPVLDLGAGEVAGLLAWTDHVLGALLDARAPGLRRRVRREVRARVLDPFRQRRDWSWLRPPLSNWTAWIHANVLAAALALLDGPDDAAERAQVVALVAGGVDDYLASLPADGAIDEGHGYWWAGACRALEALTLLDHATGGTLDASALPIVRALVDYPHRMQLGPDRYLAVADGSATAPVAAPWHVLHDWARRTGAPDAARHAEASRPDALVVDEMGQLGRLVGALAHDWPEHRPGPPLVADVWLPSTQVAVARPAAGTPRGLTLAVKGGHNDEHHNHCDVGAVVVAADGVPVVVDPGRPTYTAQTFGPDRYDIWTMRSAWHSVPTVRGHEQPPGRRFAARDVGHAVDAEGTTVRLDLAGAYPDGVVERWTRTARLDRTSVRVTVDDHWTLPADTPTASTAPTVVHYVLAGTVTPDGPGRVLVQPLDGAPRTLLTWDATCATGALTVRDLDDPMLTQVWGDRLTRLDLTVDDHDGHGRLTLTVEVLA